jgi:hypothetical protein
MGIDRPRPDVTDEEIGMRTFQIRKARAVERAIERLRQGLGEDWTKFSEPEIEALSFALGELWAYIAHSEWEDLHFGLLTITDVRKILNLTREMVNHRRNSVEVLQEISVIVAARD